MTRIDYYFPHGDAAIMAHLARMHLASSALWMFNIPLKKI